MSAHFSLISPLEYQEWVLNNPTSRDLKAK